MRIRYWVQLRKHVTRKEGPVVGSTTFLGILHLRPTCGYLTRGLSNAYVASLILPLDIVSFIGICSECRGVSRDNTGRKPAGCVSFRAKTGKWIAQGPRAGGHQSKFLGSFPTKELARAALQAFLSTPPT